MEMKSILFEDGEEKIDKIKQSRPYVMQVGENPEDGLDFRIQADREELLAIIQALVETLVSHKENETTALVGTLLAGLMDTHRKEITDALKNYK